MPDHAVAIEGNGKETIEVMREARVGAEFMSGSYVAVLVAAPGIRQSLLI